MIGGGEEVLTLEGLQEQLQTPIDHIVGFVELMIECAEDERVVRRLPQLFEIRAEAKQLADLVASAFDPVHAQETLSNIAMFHKQVSSPLTRLNVYVRSLASDLEDPEMEQFRNDLLKVNAETEKLHEVMESSWLQMAASLSRQGSDWQGSDAMSVRDMNLEADVQGYLLVVDDDALNREMLSRRLERRGHRVAVAESAEKAWELMQAEAFDLLLLDTHMPAASGDDLLRKVKADPALRNVPVIMLTSTLDTETMVRCITMGAEDCLPKAFDPVLLKARIGASLKQKNLQVALSRELSEAASYVESLLPPKQARGEVEVNWKFIPCTRLGGDSFSYHNITPEHTAICLLDVCGHGVGATLLSVSVLHVLRAQTLSGVDFTKPGQVLEGLSDSFPMEEQNGMYFTIWYGVYHAPTRKLTCACGGHPPAVVLREIQEDGPRDGEKEAHELRPKGPFIGGFSGIKYEESEWQIESGDHLVLFSDGVHEIFREDGSLVSFEEFIEVLKLPEIPAVSLVDRVYSQVSEINAADGFDDDYSMLSVKFY